MRKIIILSIVVCATIAVKAQFTERLTFATTVGTGLSVSVPASTPFTWQVLGYYNVSRRLSVGVGSGLAFYEKMLIPLFGDIRFMILRPRKFTPYLECGVGYSFAPDENANGGFYLNPSIGLQYSIYRGRKLFLAFGYELQKLERLKKQKQLLFTTEFSEKLNHNSVSVKLGFMF